MKATTFEVPRPPRSENAVLVGHAGRDRDHLARSMEELALLADTAGAKVVGTLTQRRGSIHPAHFIGKGKVDELKALVAASDADLDTMIEGITGAIAQNAPLTIALAKAAAREIAKPESKQNHKKLEKMAEPCFDSDDFKEGRRAFMEKRKPMFKGR